MRVAFFGLGTMGRPMALNLIRKGHALAVFDVVTASCARFTNESCRIASSPRDAAQGAEAVIAMLPSSHEVRDALLGSAGAAAAMPAGTLFIDMSTGSASESSARGKELDARGIRMLDAPVGRTPADAERGALMVIVGGREEDVATARPLFEGDGRHDLLYGTGRCRHPHEARQQLHVDGGNAAGRGSAHARRQMRPRSEPGCAGAQRHDCGAWPAQCELSEKGTGWRHHAGLSAAHGLEGHKPRARVGAEMGAPLSLGRLHGNISRWRAPGDARTRTARRCCCYWRTSPG